MRVGGGVGGRAGKRRGRCLVTKSDRICGVPEFIQGQNGLQMANNQEGTYHPQEKEALALEEQVRLEGKS